MTTNIVYRAYRIWAKDWSKNITIEASPKDIRKWAKSIRKIIGNDFQFELSLMTEKPQYFIDNKNGLIAY